MGKQKIVLKVHMEDAKKRAKAMKTAGGFIGVLSASLEGQDKIVVVGEGIDSIMLIKAMRKRIGHAELIGLTPVEEKKEEKKSAVEFVPWSQPYFYVPPPYYPGENFGF